MAFWMYCDCGPDGQMRLVAATKVNYCPPVHSFGDQRAKPQPMNKCAGCGKLWPAPARRGARASRRQTTLNFGGPA